MIGQTFRKVLVGLLLCFVVEVFAETLKGHLQPLGSHKPPIVVIEEFTSENAPRPQEFFENYVKPSKAAIFRGVVTGSESYNLWTDEYVREKYGEMEVRLEGKHEKRHMPPVGEKYLGRDTLRHFIDTYHRPGDNTYIISDLPESMYGESPVVPSVGACGEMSRRIVEVNLWWSGGGSVSILHKDAYNQMNCLMNGTKYWKLIENKYEKYIHKHWEPEYEQGGFSDVNVHAVDLIKHPNIAKIEWSNFTINSGDCLFLPKSYYHQVTSSGTHNLAVSLLFGRFDGRESLDFSDCTETTDYRSLRPLTDFDVQLIWKGTGVMVMGSADLEDQFRREFISHTENCESTGKRCDYEDFLEMYNEINPDDKDTYGDFATAFAIMDINGDGVITTEEMKALTLDDLRKIGREIDAYEPSNNYNFEYSIVSYEKVWWAIKYYLEKHDILDQETWLLGYLKLGGTRDFGLEVFMKLSKGKSEIVSKSVTKDDINNALENYRQYWAPQYSNLSEKPEVDDDSTLQEMWNDGAFLDLKFRDERSYEMRKQDKKKNEQNQPRKEEL